MRKPQVRERRDDGALSLLEYLLLVALIVAAALAGMTFLGPASEKPPANVVSPNPTGVRTRVASESWTEQTHRFFQHRG
jgi:hypothetical protein